MAVELEDEWYLPGEMAGTGLDESEWGRVGVAPGIEPQLEMVMRIIAAGIGRKTSGRTVLEPLVHRQDHQFPRARQLTVI